MTELPTIEEELTRKALDELEALLHRRDTNRITNAEFKIGIDVLFSICSGLVDSEFFEMITMAGSEVEFDNSFLRSRQFAHIHKVTRVVIGVERDGTKVFVDRYEQIASKIIDVGEDASHEDVQAKIRDLVKTLTKSKFKEI